LQCQSHGAKGMAEPEREMKRGRKGGEGAIRRSEKSFSLGTFSRNICHLVCKVQPGVCAHVIFKA